MNRVIDWLLSREGRKWLYSVAVAVVPLLVLYGAISQEAAPLWLAVCAALLGVAAPAMALSHLTPAAQAPEDSISVPENLDSRELDLES